ncbi:hypothetical protein DVR12_10570 [Chitinophaga silvatica]|uniref:FixH protein n=1 Tax=Chitinophaga silvatica TaxID=2282649 RepID=A0A3E1YBS4_9BACT|nr:FixH family protein [Chitinophaga silvatica]RFS23449.1 hypothetical protein DVR12_10570 [Chitinophaga silvatica]
MNWGYKIIIVFVVFAAGMLTLVTKSLRTKIDMVTPDYYKEELKYQQVIDGKQNANNLSTPITISQPGESVVLTFPQEMREKPISGQLTFYRPSDSRKDVSVPLKIDEAGQLLIEKTRFTTGLYKVKLQWSMNDRPYYQEQTLTIN